ncbi:MAG: GMC family oxidoreductase [Paracoccaceae bacterium]
MAAAETIPETESDYVVVGAGSAGAVLANRLSEDGHRSVTVLEAGGSDWNVWVQIPLGYGRCFFHSALNWRLETEACDALGGRRNYWPRGKVMGGSSSINAMVWVRGHPADFDDWAREAPGWSWADVAPVFRRMEDWSGGANDHRGAGGPLPVRDITAEVHPLCTRYRAAAAELQIPWNDDYNGASMEGASIYQITTKGGFRASTARCYLRPALGRANLRLELHAEVTRILIEGGRAVGVEFRRNGRLARVRARREVILSAGAIGSPKILQLSGLGPAEHLARLGIPVHRDMREVGRNLQDHLGLSNIYRTRVPTLNQVLRPWSGRIRCGLDYVFRRRGPLSMSVNQGGGFLRLRPEADRPDIQVYFSPLSYSVTTPGYRALMEPDAFPGLILGFNPTKPTSRGHLAIRTADPSDPPEIHPNYLATEDDRALIREGVRLMRRIAAAPALAEVIDAEVTPGDQCQSDDELGAFARDHASTVFHPCGTCRMGRAESGAVVDHRLRVHGVAGLRVVDASIFPTIPTGNTNAPAIMVGERGAELIREDAALGAVA